MLNSIKQINSSKQINANNECLLHDMAPQRHNNVWEYIPSLVPNGVLMKRGTKTVEWRWRQYGRR